MSICKGFEQARNSFEHDATRMYHSVGYITGSLQYCNYDCGYDTKLGHLTRGAIPNLVRLPALVSCRTLPY